MLASKSRTFWSLFTTAWRYLSLRIKRRLPDKEYIEQAVADSRQWAVLQFDGWV
jgi:hypothetical protein